MYLLISLYESLLHLVNPVLSSVPVLALYIYKSPITYILTTLINILISTLHYSCSTGFEMNGRNE